MAVVNTSSFAIMDRTTSGAVGGTGVDGTISGDGRFVAFTAYGDLGFGRASSSDQGVYLRDTVLNTTQIVSINRSGGFSDGRAGGSSVSEDGRFVVFSSDAVDLVANDTSTTTDIFLRDMQSGTTLRVSAPGGVEANNNSGPAKITPDGRYVFYSSSASNLAAGDANGAIDVFRYDVFTQETILVSRATGGGAANGGSILTGVSEDGRFATFYTTANNLGAPDGNGNLDVYVRDLDADVTTLVSAGAGGSTVSGTSLSGAMDASGRHVFFTSTAALTAGDTNGTYDVFRRDTATGVTTLLTQGLNGQNANGSSGVGGSNGSVDVSADGRYVVFDSAASNLVQGDTNGFTDVFVRDTVLGITTRLSAGLNDAGGSGSTPKISADGKYVVFTSAAQDLTVGAPANNGFHVYRVSLFATNQADILVGSDAADSIDGLKGGDLIRGGFGNDTITGGLGRDDMYGGEGSDVFYVDRTGDKVFELVSEIGFDTIFSSATYRLAEGQFVELLTLTGTANINATGNTSSNIIKGNSGNNVLNGGAGFGSDTLEGGAGNDTYYLFGSDTVIEANGGGTDIVYTDSSFSAAGNFVETIILSGEGGITGNTLNNTLTAGGGDDVLDGGAGADTMTGGGGSDVYVVDNAGDRVVETEVAGFDEVQSSITYTLGNFVEKLTLTGTGAINGTGNTLANQLVGNDGNNSLVGGDGADTFSGGLGADTFSGGAGDDVYFIDDATDRIVDAAGAGTETVISSITFTLNGLNVEKLTLIGGALDGAGNGLTNTLIGNGLANVLNGLTASDTLTGGGGADTFAFSSVLGAANIDVIADFSHADDTIQLEDSIFRGIAAPGTTLTADMFRKGAGATGAADATDRIIYDTTSGALYFDRDGTGATYAAIQFATLTGNPDDVDQTDFALI